MKTISVIMATFNSGDVLEKCLRSIRKQEYDQAKVEIIIADGDSTDKTAEIAKKYNGKIILENTGSPESAKAIALKHAKNEILLMAASDNILPHKKWLKKMVSFFDKEPEITGCYPWRYTYQKKGKILNRYFALLGANDPVAYFLGKADRQSYFSSRWSLAGKAKDKGDYFLVKFNKNNMPTLGDNGFLIKRKTLLKAKIDEKHFFHIDVNWDLVSQGYNQFIVVKNDIVHSSGEKFWEYFRKRKKYMENLYLHNLEKRRYFLYKKGRDQKKIIAYSFYSLTLILPIIDSFRGYSKVKDRAWFLHPLICFLIFWIYFLSVINWQAWHYLGILETKLKRIN